jgi:DHA3 family macrolide efflux protein-like MFS transporter
MDQNQSKSMKSFFFLWTGQAASLFGSQLVQFALIWWLTESTGSATVLAMASLVGLLPQVVLGPMIGVLVDRWNRRLIMLVSDSAVAAATILLAYLYWIGTVQVWHVFMILFVRALAGSFHFPSMMASTSLMVPESQLTRIQGLNQMLQGGLSIASAPLGALLLTLLPMQGVLAIDVLTAMFAVVPLFLVTIPQPKRLPNEQTASALASFGSELKEGFLYVRGWRGLLILTGMAMIVKILLNPAFALIPLLVTDHFGGGAFQLGFLESAWGIGVVVGGILLSLWGGFKRRIVTTQVGLLGLGFSLLTLGVAPASRFALGVVGIFAAGLVIPLVDGPIMAILQATIPPDKQGRVFMLFGSLVSSTAPLGLIIAGPVADSIGVRFWFIAAALLTIVMTVAGFFIPAYLNIEEGRRRAESVDDSDSAKTNLATASLPTD